MLPEIPEPEIEFPFGSEVTTFVNWIGMVVVEGLDEIWKVATATLPAAITVESIPQTMHVFPEQETDLFALEDVLPTTTLTLVMSDV